MDEPDVPNEIPMAQLASADAAVELAYASPLSRWNAEVQSFGSVGVAHLPRCMVEGVEKESGVRSVSRQPVTLVSMVLMMIAIGVLASGRRTRPYAPYAVAPFLVFAAIGLIEGLVNRLRRRGYQMTKLSVLLDALRAEAHGQGYQEIVVITALSVFGWPARAGTIFVARGKRLAFFHDRFYRTVQFRRGRRIFSRGAGLTRGERDALVRHVGRVIGTPALGQAGTSGGVNGQNAEEEGQGDRADAVRWRPRRMGGALFTVGVVPPVIRSDRYWISGPKFGVARPIRSVLSLGVLAAMISAGIYGQSWVWRLWMVLLWVVPRILADGMTLYRWIKGKFSQEGRRYRRLRRYKRLVEPAGLVRHAVHHSRTGSAIALFPDALVVGRKGWIRRNKRLSRLGVTGIIPAADGRPIRIEYRGRVWVREMDLPTPTDSIEADWLVGLLREWAIAATAGHQTTHHPTF